MSHQPGKTQEAVKSIIGPLPNLRQTSPSGQAGEVLRSRAKSFHRPNALTSLYFTRAIRTRGKGSTSSGQCIGTCEISVCSVHDKHAKPQWSGPMARADEDGFASRRLCRRVRPGLGNSDRAVAAAGLSVAAIAQCAGLLFCPVAGHAQARRRDRTRNPARIWRSYWTAFRASP